MKIKFNVPGQSIAVVEAESPPRIGESVSVMMDKAGLDHRPHFVVEVRYTLARYSGDELLCFVDLEERGRCDQKQT